ncbi:MAG: amidase [Acidobacteriota bacterium]|jgi:amidase|nr:amidase [Acidobacteriota bacterium]
MSQDKKERLSSRRDFLRYSAMGGALALASPAVIVSAESSIPSTTVSGKETFELEEATIAELQAGMKSGKWTARSLAEKYLSRIEKIDKQGPAVNSIIELNPDALGIADSLDKERKAKGARGALHGIPVLIKDNIGTADRMTTTAGSLALSGSIPLKDSFVAQRLRAAGAVILGKTNLSEWANIRSSHSTSGWSGRGGQTKNPYVLDRNPCGSSSGSGAAIAANLAAVAVGTETDGSVVCPSSTNSLVGIKPTLGLVSRSGIIPIAHSQDTAGPMARTVTDAAILLSALAGIDPDDAITNESQGHSSPDYTQSLDANGLRGARIGVVRKNFGFNDQVDQLINSSLDVMKRLGAEIVDPAEIETAGKFDDTELEVLLYELKSDLNKYLAGLGPHAPVHSLKEIIEFNERNKEREMPYFGQDLFIKAEAKGPLTDKDYMEALAKNQRLSRTEGIDAVMTKNKLDAMVAPTGGPPWPTDLINGDHFTGGYSTASAVAGYPHLTVPAGYIHGLPVGLSFFGRAYSEPMLIKLAFAFEQATKARRPPQFLPHVDLRV